ncbi:hypothetical protein [Neolewinella agarilytica]|uniref:Dolichyl-phosphate-mannose-protein mannosyltransferase n=1 Tax=Neolewinella agarilytica TaxID=478744 RepID=A0A1H9MRU4_9BACT|nr:hypothetical protein [Neolewinella agarilytica]SER26440.1 hypothetical protein SAMN05444359_13119 [Neolewinella agarilytica]
MIAQQEKINSWLALGPILFINFLFVWKYGSRATDRAVVAAALLVAVQVGWVLLSDSISVSDKWTGRIVIAAGLLLLVFAALAAWVIPLESLNVDRWSVISSFWEAAAEGKYPYFAESHMGNPPGPMPVYFVIAWPFYALGALDTLAAVGYLLLLFGLYRTPAKAKRLVPLLLTSVFMFWEIAVRSNIFTYSVLVMFALEYFRRRQDKAWGTNLMLQAIVIGLLLSTRSVFALAYVSYFLASLKLKEMPFGRMVAFGSVALVAFGLSFLPFVLIWPESFREMNPFLVQSSFLLPAWFIPGFFGLAAASALLIKRSEDVPLAAGWVLFLCILLYAIFHVLTSGFEEAFFGSKVDLSYFLLAVPFLYGTAGLGMLLPTAISRRSGM